MPDLPDPGHPYDDFPSEPPRKRLKVEFVHVVMGFLYVPVCFLAGGMLSLAFGEYRVEVPLLLIGAGCYVAARHLEMKGVLYGALLALGLGVLGFLLLLGICSVG